MLAMATTVRGEGGDRVSWPRNIVGGSLGKKARSWQEMTRSNRARS